MNSKTQFKVGQKVTWNGNKEGQILKIHTGQLEGMVDVRLWSGFRLIGEFCVCLQGLERENS